VLLVIRKDYPVLTLTALIYIIKGIPVTLASYIPVTRGFINLNKWLLGRYRKNLRSLLLFILIVLKGALSLLISAGFLFLPVTIAQVSGVILTGGEGEWGTVKLIRGLLK